MTGSVVNLNKFRKSRVHDEKRKQADENAVKFGRSKAEREIDVLRADKAESYLDNHKRDK